MTPYQWHRQNLTKAVKSLNPKWHLEGLGEFNQTSTRIITDTRKLEKGDIFLAIKGDNFDGHDYLQTAKDKGAIAAIVSAVQTVELPQLVVADTKQALGQLGAYRRNQHLNLKVVAITGSSGKTTTKEMLGSILNRIAPTLITRGNLNNDLGVPMMLLELCEEHRYAVMELGANHIGEIAYTTQLVKPDVACVLNIGTAHLGEFGSRDKICQAKSEIFAGLDSQKIAVVPDNDDYTNQLRRIASDYTSHIIGFGSMGFEKSDIVACQPQIKNNGSEFRLAIDAQNAYEPVHEVNLQFVGEHNIANALAAAACAKALGISQDDIAKGLSEAKPAKGRLNIQQFGKHQLIDDTYNANPHAVRAAANVLKNQGDNTMLVLGDIGELGEASQTEHEQLGLDIAALGIDVLLTVGELTPFSVAKAKSMGMEAVAFSDKASLLDAIESKLNSSDKVWHILFKGSRYMQMETLIQDLLTVHPTD